MIFSDLMQLQAMSIIELKRIYYQRQISILNEKIHQDFSWVPKSSNRL
jgi:hypothetical protein